MTDKPLVNRVAQSGLITLNLEDYYPQGELMEIDLKDYLFRGLILKEKDFREAMNATDWSRYAGAYVSVYCSTDAIIPVWAYQLLALQLQPHARRVFFGNREQMLVLHYYEALGALDLEPYRDARIVIKGCGEKPVPAAAYMELAARLRPLAKSIMYGEPCSTVPLFKR